MERETCGRRRPTDRTGSILFDVTRLISLRWTRRQPNGIDRVCLEYLRHFRDRAWAVVQHRGVIRLLGSNASRRLYDCLFDGPRPGARARLIAHLGEALASPYQPTPGSLYLNVSHTDFDLAAHGRWVERHALRAVYLIHDLIPILHPEHCRPRAVTRHTGRVERALSGGAGLIVTSAGVASDLADYAARAGLRMPSLTISPLAGARLPVIIGSPTADKPYFLCIGTIESRKNHALLLKVWEQLRARHKSPARLIIVGSWGSGSAEFRSALQASGMAGDLIEVRAGCGDGTLAALMLGARAVLMPSLAEGYGLPVAEALALGVPVIASDLPCLREVGQGIPSLLDPHDVDAWVERIGAFDCAAAARQRRIDAFMSYCPPTWEEHFDRVDPWLATLPHDDAGAGGGDLRHAAVAQSGGRASPMGA